MQPSDGQAGPQLTGWKEIAEFLKRSIRTVQRWERELALPVHRVKTSESGGSVFAWPHELQDWLARQERTLTQDGREDSPTIDGKCDPSADLPVVLALQTAVNNENPPFQHRLAARSLLALMLTALALFAGSDVTRSDPRPDARPAAWSAPPVYVTISRGVLILDGESLELRRSMTIPPESEYASLHDSTLSSDGSALAVVTDRSPGVALIDLVSQRFTWWYPIELPRARRAALNADGTRVGVVDRLGTLLVVDVKTRRLLSQVKVGKEPYDLWSDPRTGGFVVASRDDKALFVVSHSATDALVLPLGRSAHDIVADDERRVLYVSDEYENTVACLDLAESSVIGVAAVQDHPIAIALSPDRRTVYVANRDSNSISVVDALSCAVRNTISSAVPEGRPARLAVGTSGAHLYVAALEYPLLTGYTRDRRGGWTSRTVRLPEVATGVHAR